MSKKKGKKNGNGDGVPKMDPFKTQKTEKSTGLGTFAEVAAGFFNETQNGRKNDEKGGSPNPIPISVSIDGDGLETLQGIEIPEETEAVPEVSKKELAEATAKIEETKELARNIGVNKVKKEAEISELREVVSGTPEGWELLPDGNPVKGKILSAKKKIAEIETFLSKIGEFDGTVVGEQVRFAELNAEIQLVTEKEADNKARVLTMCGKITGTDRFHFLDWGKEKDKTELRKLKKEHGGFPAGSILSPWGVYISKRGDGSPSGGQKALESNFRAMMDTHKEGIPFRMKSRGDNDISKIFKKKECLVYIYIPEKKQEGNRKKIREGHILLRKFDSSEEKNTPPRWDVKVVESFGSTATLTKEGFPLFWLVKGFPAAKKDFLSDDEWHAFSRVIKIVHSAILADEKAKSALESAEKAERKRFDTFKKKKAEKDALQKQRRVEGEIFVEYTKKKDAGEVPEETNWKKFLAEALESKPEKIPDPPEEINVDLNESSADSGLSVPKELPVPEAQMILSAPEDESAKQATV